MIISRNEKQLIKLFQYEWINARRGKWFAFFSFIDAIAFVNVKNWPQSQYSSNSYSIWLIDNKNLIMSRSSIDVYKLKYVLFGWAEIIYTVEECCGIIVRTRLQNYSTENMLENLYYTVDNYKIIWNDFFHRFWHSVKSKRNN